MTAMLTMSFLDSFLLAFAGSAQTTGSWRDYGAIDLFFGLYMLTAFVGLICWPAQTNKIGRLMRSFTWIDDPADGRDNEIPLLITGSLAALCLCLYWLILSNR